MSSGASEDRSLVESLGIRLMMRRANLANVPGLIKRVIETGAWQERIYKGAFHHDRFP
jgi:hypothetical protein